MFTPNDQDAYPRASGLGRIRAGADAPANGSDRLAKTPPAIT
jgi:hypothetical protein